MAQALAPVVLAHMTSALVSNSPVDRLPLLRNGLLVLLLSLCALLLLTILAIQIKQHIFRHRVERLLSEIQALELRKTPWQEAQTQFQQWNANRRYDDPCDAHKCSFEIVLNDFVLGDVYGNNAFVVLDNYIRWRLKLSYDVGPFEHLHLFLLGASMHVGARPARVVARIRMRDGIVWGKAIAMYIETYRGSSQYELAAEVYSVPRFDRYGGGWIDPQLLLHSNYDINRPSGCDGCVSGWVKFTPYAALVDVHRLMQLNLSCLTRWHPCLTQSDIMPAAWAQHLAEDSPTGGIFNGDGSERPLECSSLVMEILGRDSANIATGEIMEYQEKTTAQGYSEETAKVRVLERLKGAVDWKVGETREIFVEMGTGVAHPKIGSQLIFFGGSGRANEELQINPVDACPSGISLNDINLNLVRRGIEQDYTATD